MYQTKNNVFTFYSILLILHALHILEEVWGNAFFIRTWYRSFRVYLVLEITAYTIAVVLCYFTLRKNQLAHNVSYLYAGIMVFDGFYHGAILLSQGKYFGGGAGAVTGLGLITFGALLAHALWREKYPPNQKSIAT